MQWRRNQEAQGSNGAAFETAGATLSPTAGAEPAPRVRNITFIDDVSGSRKSITNNVLICTLIFAESASHLALVKVPRRSSRPVTGSDLSDKGTVGGIVNKKISDSREKPSPMQIDVIKKEDVTGAIDARRRFKADPHSQLSFAMSSCSSIHSFSVTKVSSASLLFGLAAFAVGPHGFSIPATYTRPAPGRVHTARASPHLGALARDGSISNTERMHSSFLMNRPFLVEKN